MSVEMMMKAHPHPRQVFKPLPLLFGAWGTGWGVAGAVWIITCEVAGAAGCTGVTGGIGAVGCTGVTGGAAGCTGGGGGVLISCRVRSAPQLPQNFAPSGFLNPHCPQYAIVCSVL